MAVRVLGLVVFAKFTSHEPVPPERGTVQFVSAPVISTKPVGLGQELLTVTDTLTA